METYQLKHKGEEIDAILDKAKAADPLEDLAEIREGASKGATAVQPRKESGKVFVETDGLVTSDDEYYYLPSYAPADDPQHTFAMKSDIQGGSTEGFIPMQRQFSDEFNNDFAR